MVEADKDYLRKMLLRRRQDIFNRLKDMEHEWRTLSERDIELEEEAQKTDLTLLFDQLDEMEKNEIEEIDLALTKLAVGNYGRCEMCSNTISLKRLEILPATRLCRKCALHLENTKEKLPPVPEIINKGEVPFEYKDLRDEEVLQAIWENLKETKELDLEELDITYQNGVIYLDGLIPSENEHRFLRDILFGSMGFSTLVDRLIVDETAWEREDRTPGRAPSSLEDDMGITQKKELTDDQFEAQEEGIPYSFPETPGEEK